MGSIHQVRSCYSQFVSGWVLKLICRGIRAFADMPWAAIDIHEKYVTLNWTQTSGCAELWAEMSLRQPKLLGSGFLPSLASPQ